MAPQTPKRTTGMRLIRSHNTVHNRRRLARSMFANRIFLGLTAVAAVFFVVQGLRFYQNERNWGGVPLLSEQEVAESVTGNEPISEVPADSSIDSQESGGQAPATSSTPTTQPNAGSACGSNIPSGACTAIESIETEGIKVSKYVLVDTSQMPEGTTVKFNRASWAASGSDMAAISGDLVYSGQPYKVNVTFALQNSQWVATGYSAQ